MGAGFIYLIIVGLWVAYFLPRWISSHEEHLGRSIDRYQALLDAVGRTATGIAPIRLSEVEREARLQTRRLTFLALTVLLIITILLNLVGLLSPSLLLVPILGFAAYLLVVRRQSLMDERIKESELLQGSSLHPRAASEQRMSERSVKSEIYRSKYAELIVSVHDESVQEQWTPLADRESYQSSGIVLLPKGSAGSRDTWQPTPVPAPTYLSSSRIVPTRKVIDLTNPGAWSSRNNPQSDDEIAKIEQEALAALAPNPDEIFDQEVAEAAAARISRLRKAN
jgi:hypothetical protein